MHKNAHVFILGHYNTYVRWQERLTHSAAGRAAARVDYDNSSRLPQLAHTSFPTIGACSGACCFQSIRVLEMKGGVVPVAVVVIGFVFVVVYWS